jgi:hypothetical protein
VAAIPHNLEAFANRNVGAELAADFAAEVARLRRADAVFTIAREEGWLLEAQGVTTSYLPYYPDPVLAGACARIREQRRERAGPDGRVAGPLLILGSAFNPSTARGMRRQLEWLREGPVPPAGIVVAGYQTDAVLADAVFPGVRLAGGVDADALAGWLGSASALLLHTEGGTGAVTRIPEALLAGVPVIANRNAARDQFGTPGVQVYDDRAEFVTLTAAGQPMPPPPARPSTEEGRFLSRLREWTAARQGEPAG